MSVVFEGSIDEDCIRYEHHSLVVFYIGQSQRHSEKAMENHKEGLLQPDSISAIVFAAMTIEAFVNEVAESVYEKKQLEDFYFLKNEFKKKGKLSSVTKKVVMLFQKVHNYYLPEDLLLAIEKLIKLRNGLVHYKLSDTATKIVYPPMKHTKLDDGQVFTTIDFLQKPKTVIPPFVQKITGGIALESYNTALDIIKLWSEQRK